MMHILRLHVSDLHAVFPTTCMTTIHAGTFRLAYQWLSEFRSEGCHLLCRSDHAIISGRMAAIAAEHSFART